MPTNSLQTCLISRFDLNPPSGSTISKSQTALRADVDVQLPMGTTDFEIFASIFVPDSIKAADFIGSSGVEKSINGTTGRAFIAFSLNDSRFPIPGSGFSSLFSRATITKADGSTSTCELQRTVDYTLVD